jgi:hypothetical protein
MYKMGREDVTIFRRLAMWNTSVTSSRPILYKEAKWRTCPVRDDPKYTFDDRHIPTQF